MSTTSREAVGPVGEPGARGEAERPGSDIQGWLDAVEGDRVFGWAWDRRNPDEHIEIEVWLGEDRIGAVTADQPRGDLRENGIGDGRHAFEIRLAAANDGGESLKVLARAPAGGAPVPLKRRSAAEAVADGIIGPPLKRIAGMIDGLGAAQRHFHGIQRTALEEVRKSIERRGGGKQPSEIAKTLDEIRTMQQSLAKQMADTEVFLIRFDSALRGLAEEAKGKRGGADRPLRRAVAVLAAVSILTLGLATLAVLRGTI